jgi:P27 family predicted phage terminase small subunit
MKNSKMQPPKELSTEAKRQWNAIVEQFDVDDAAGALLLNQAMQAYDEVLAAKVILKKDGSVIRDRWGQQKQHPAALNLRDARNLMLRCLKQMNLDITPGAPLGGK